MNTTGHARLARRTVVVTACATAALVAGGGLAFASSNGTASPATPQSPSLRYIVGANVSVPAHTAVANSAICPSGMYPVGGGPSSSHATWETEWSGPGRSTATAAHPNEWAVSLLNNSGSTALYKVYVVCSTAHTVSGNY